MSERLNNLILNVGGRYPGTKRLITDGDSMSGNEFVLVPGFFDARPGSGFSPNAVFKVFPENTIPDKERRLIEQQQRLAGARYSELFWPYEIITIDGRQVLASPQFAETVSQQFRQKTLPPIEDITNTVAAIADTLTGVGQVYRGPTDRALTQEITGAFTFVAQTLDRQLSPLSPYKNLPNRLRNVVPLVERLIPAETTLSGNDCWLGNIICINRRAWIVDPKPDLPFLKELDFPTYLESCGLQTPELRHVFLDWSRVSVNLRRFVLEWNQRGFIDEANAMEITIWPGFRQRAIREVGSNSLVLGELLNNALFATCNCEACSESGTLQLSLSETERLLQKVIS